MNVFPCLVASLSLVAVGGALSARLAAQDITVAEPMWFSAEPLPDAPLKTGNLKPRVPDELRKSDEIGFGVVSRSVSEAGKDISIAVKATHPPLERALEAEAKGEIGRCRP